jgi:hypothetical protein
MEGAKETKAVMAQVQALWASLKASRLVQAGRMLLIAPRCVASSPLSGRHPADEVVLLGAGHRRGHVEIDDDSLLAASYCQIWCTRVDQAAALRGV